MWNTLDVLAEPARISVIIPCYNLGAFVGKAIDSTLSQSRCAAEVIVVDNGSDDDSESIIARYHESIRKVQIYPNKGVSYARNEGVKQATGNWFLFLDADDYLNDDALLKLSACAELGGSGVVFGGIVQYDPGTKQYSRRDSPSSEGPPPLPAVRGFWRAAIATPGAAIVHRSVHQMIGGFEKPWQPTEDRDYWLKCGVTTPFRYCDHVVLTKLRREESMRMFSGWIPFWGMRVQLEFLDWCRQRNIEVEPFNVRVNDIVVHALDKAVKNGQEEIVEQIVNYCVKRDIPTPSLFWHRLHGKIRDFTKRVRP